MSSMTRRFSSQALTLLMTLTAGRIVWLAVVYFEGGRVGRHRLETAWFALVLLGISRLALSRGVGHDGPSTELRPSSLPIWLMWIFVGSSLALYLPAIWVGLFSDDFTLLGLETTSILRVTSWEHFRPIPLMAWKLLFPLASAPALHLVNIVLHGLNAWLTFRLVARLGHDASVSAIAGLIFLTFPGAVEPVVWSSGIFDVAMVTFGLLYLHACLGGGHLAMSVIWLAAALLSKETAVALPLVAVVLRMRTRMSVRPIVASVALTIGYVALRFAWGLAIPHRELASIRYAVKETIVRPFASLSIPYTAAELTHHPLLLGAASVTLVAVLVCLYCMREDASARPIASSALVLIGVLPLWQFVFIGDMLDGSRYLYLPLVGWTVLLSDLIDGDRVWPRYARALAVVVILVLPGTWYVRQHLHAWEEAAQLRDAVLQSANRSLAESGCPSGQFQNVPDSWQGVYVFRNGFSEALDRRAVPAGGDVPPACDFTWTSGRFVRTEK